MPQMSNLNWFILSMYFILIYLLLIILINFMNYDLLIKSNKLNNCNMNFNMSWN